MKKLRLFRVVLASVLFAWLNLGFIGVVEGIAPLVRFQPLPAILSLDAVAIAIVLAVTLGFGRVTCSILCPMGFFLEMVSWLRHRLVGPVRFRRTFVSAASKVRMVALVASVALIAAGFVSLGALLDGYSLYGRIAAHVLHPAYLMVQNMAGGLLAELGHPVLFREEVFVHGTCALVVAGTAFVGLAVTAWLGGRAFCNTLCPVGALLSLAARRPLARLSIDAAQCVGCGRCQTVCEVGAIDPGRACVDDSACVRCLACAGACPTTAIKWVMIAGDARLAGKKLTR